MSGTDDAPKRDDPMDEEEWVDIPTVAAHLCGTECAVLTFTDADGRRHTATAGDVPTGLLETLAEQVDQGVKGPGLAPFDEVSDSRPWYDVFGFGVVALEDIKDDTGARRGALAVIDTRPRSLGAQARAGLSALVHHLEHELKRGDEAGDERMQRFRGAVLDAANAAQVGIAVVGDGETANPRIIYINDAAAAILGAPVEKLVGSFALDLLTDVERERMLAREDWGGHEPPSFVETTIVRPDGTEVPIAVAIAEMELEGRPTTFAFLHDITQQRALERALEQQEMQMRAIVRDAPLVLFALDPDGTLTFVEGSGLERLERLAGDLIGLDVTDLLPGDGTVDKAVASALKGDPVQLELGHRGGHYRLHLTPIRDRTGAVTRVIGVATDITEQRHAERKAREAEARSRDLERREELRRSRLTLLNAASHALNTPLTPLRLKVHMLAKGLLGDLSPRQQDALAVMQRNVDQLAALVVDILDIVRLESNMLDLQTEPVDLVDLTSAMIATFAPVAAERGVTVLHKGDGSVVVDADPTRVRQVLHQMLDRAIEVTPRGGRVVVDCRTAGEDAGTLAVLDDGPAAHDALADSLDRFFRGEEESTRFTGLELGVTAVLGRAIAEGHGGSIRYIRGGGRLLSGFEMRFPLAATRS